jgi:hypothetical protein
MSLSSLKAADFEPHLGEEFTVSAADANVAFKLAQLERIGAALRAGGAFSLLFLSAPGPILPQGIYAMAHPTLGTLELFIVPLGPKDGQNRYEVVFT